jgi:excinuclease ABC subunit A
MNEFIKITNANENNLKNVSISLPKNKLIIFTGVSGCGKSSLAFSTIYEEGQRRYLESLNTYARQFLGGNKKPNVEKIEGLSPTISIEQKTSSHNPRSTVGTVTEIYDFLRVLYSKIGVPYCPNGHGKIEALTLKQIETKILQNIKDNDKIIILSPYIKNSKGTFKNEFEKLKRDGFLRVRLDGNFINLDEITETEKNKIHNLDIVIDRIVAHKDSATITRINESIENALKYGNNQVLVLINDKETLYSRNHSCKVCGFSVPEIEPRMFSFNAPTGACSTCKGLGTVFKPDKEKIISNPELSINDGGIDYFKNLVNTTNLE